MALQPLHSEFPYIWGKFSFLFYQCMIGGNFKLFFFTREGVREDPHVGDPAASAVHGEGQSDCVWFSGDLWLVEILSCFYLWRCARRSPRWGPSCECCRRWRRPWWGRPWRRRRTRRPWTCSSLTHRSSTRSDTPPLVMVKKYNSERPIQKITVSLKIYLPNSLQPCVTLGASLPSFFF